MRKFSDFIEALFRSSYLKLRLTWLSFLFLAVPTALLVTLGIPERIALPCMAGLVLPFMYAAFCVAGAERSSAVKTQD